MKVMYQFFIVGLLCSITADSFAMKPRPHIPRNKKKKRLRSSKEEHMERFLHGVDQPVVYEKVPVTEKVVRSANTTPKRKRSRSFTLTTIKRRFSTGQIHTVEKTKKESPQFYSPSPMKRQSSSGLIDITPETRAALKLLKERQERAREEIDKQKKQQNQEE